jgi:hypothetical protein
MTGEPSVHVTWFDDLAVRTAAAALAAGDVASHDRVHAMRRRIDEPLRVAIAGRAKSGKSTLLNALVGEAMAPTDASECTRVVTWYENGRSYGATAELRDGGRAAVPLHREGLGVSIDLAGLDEESIERLVVEWPNRTLRAMTIIDTPGIGSLSGIGRRTTRFLAGDDEEPTGSPADAVLYLTKHVHRDDVAFLEAFHDHDGGSASPVNAIGVLARADEIVGGRVEAFASAAAIAARTARDPAIRRLCQTVVPLAGLVAEAASTLTEAEYQAIRRLAGLAEDEAAELLLSVDRFRGPEGFSCGLSDDERRILLDRFGIYGVRLGRSVLRARPDLGARGLADELRRLSGLDDLVQLLGESFTARRDLLKLRSAVTSLGQVLAVSPGWADAAEGLRRELESLRAGAHELVELDLLLALRRGDTELDERAVAEAEQLLAPGDAAARLGLTGAEPEVLWQEVLTRIGRWRARSEHPLANPQAATVARGLVRTLEGFAATLRR